MKNLIKRFSIVTVAITIIVPIVIAVGTFYACNNTDNNPSGTSTAKQGNGLIKNNGNPKV